MLNQQISNLDNLIFNYIFDDSIERVFEIFSTPKHFYQIYSPYLTDLILYKGDKFDQIGTLFQFIWKTELKIDVIIEDVVNQKDFKMIKMFFFRVKPTDFIYHIYFKLRWISTEKVTYFTHICVFDTIQSLSFFQLQHDYEEKLGIFKNVSIYLKTFTELLSQSESVVLNISMDRLWQIITHFDLLISYVPILADSFEICNDGIKISKESRVSFLEVVRETLSRDSGEYVIKVSNGIELHFKLIGLSKNSSLLILVHKFNESIPVSSFDILSQRKRLILMTLQRNV
jgi:hypothetical protein